MASLADVFAGHARYAVEPCDCRFGMACMPSDSIDAIVTDAPYELGFMGKRWDSSGIAFDVTVWREALRVAKPGSHLVAFGGTRTFHRMACAIEDAGWDIRDCLCWMYGSGFPKSLNVSKAIDAALGAARAPDEYSGPNGKNGVYGANMGGGITLSRSDPCTAAAAAAAAGFGTALKPAFEPVVLARKPLNGTVAANFMRHGTGALNIDGCRIEGPKDVPTTVSSRALADLGVGWGFRPTRDASGCDPNVGRWPANVVMDEEAAAVLDAEAGDRPGMTGGGLHSPDYAGGIFGKTDARYVDDICTQARGDTGGPSRFFYTAKASRSERDAGLDDFEARTAGSATDREDDTDGLNSPRAGAGRTGGARNIHPTVKPVDLMRWLVRLVGRKDALILDPFTGSGSTGVAAMLEGMRFVGLELEPLHVDFARARIAHVIGGTWEREVKPERPVMKAQPGLFDAVGK